MRCESREVYHEIEKKFVEWAKTVDDIKAAFVVGSRARHDHPADDYSDLDIVMYTSSPQPYLMDSKWVEHIGKPICSFVYQTAGGDPERLCLFEGGWQVDFVIHPYNKLQDMIRTQSIPTFFHRGVRTLIDKEKMSVNIIPKSFKKPEQNKINEEVFIQHVNMFWFTTLYTAKQIMRKEMWVAKARDGNIKELLLQMMEWYSKTINGDDYDTWHAGRFLNEWAPEDVLVELSHCFGHYDEQDSLRALNATLTLYSRISQHIANTLNYAYPVHIEKSVKDWIEAHKK